MARSSTSPVFYVIVGLFVIPPFVYGISWFIVTDREQIRMNVRAVLSAFEENDPKQFLSHMDGKVRIAGSIPQRRSLDLSSDEGLTHGQLEELFDQATEQYEIRENTIHSMSVTLDGKRASVDLSIRSFVKAMKSRQFSRAFPVDSEWKISLVRDKRAWKITRVEMVKSPGT